MGFASPIITFVSWPLLLPCLSRSHLLISFPPALQWKSQLCIPFLGIARPQSQFPHSCVCERFLYSQDRSTYLLQQNRQIVGIYKSLTGTWVWILGLWPRNSFSGIPFSNFLYCFFAVCSQSLKAIAAPAGHSLLLYRVSDAPSFFCCYSHGIHCSSNGRSCSLRYSAAL